MKIFLAGIIQGSIVEDRIHTQDYREELKRVLRQAIPETEVFCPIEHHPQSLDYSFDKGRDVFMYLVRKAAESDVLITFLPQASMGTSVEMWEAYRHGRLIITISPLKSNWVVKFLSHRIFATIEEFERFAESGSLAELISAYFEGPGNAPQNADAQNAKG
ncbi:MAG TPA: hypothetical protein VM141_12920 [Planctomycetota bacterium]|nr:hypothetical protein [Planctomycetota bacterium]